MLNPNSPLPLYHQLAEILMDRIRHNTYPSGARIPSEHELAGQYRIGRPTVRQATDLLIQRGILERRRGSGTYVIEPRPQIGLFSLAGTLSAFRQKGLAVDATILAPLVLEAVDMDPDNPFSGRRAFHFTRLSKVGGKPVLLESFFLDPVLFAGIEAVDLKGRSLSELVAERFFLTPVGGHQSFRVAQPDAATAAALELPPATHLLLVNRTIDFTKAPAAVFALMWCRTDRFTFSQQLPG